MISLNLIKKIIINEDEKTTSAIEKLYYETSLAYIYARYI